MKRVLCSHLPQPGRPVTLDESEAGHAIQVWRLRDGDTVEALDGRGNSTLATLRVRGKLAQLEFRAASVTKPESGPLPIALELAVLKGDAMAWVIEKAVELGVESLYPVVTAHTVVQLKQKGPEAFQGRWQKIADQALKQCGRLTKMEIHPPRALDEMLTDPWPRLWMDEAGPADQAAYLADWLESQPIPRGRIGILIGPEGGWSAAERERLLRAPNTHRIQLGPLTLRAETAAIFAISVVSAQMRRRGAPLNEDLDKYRSTKGT